MTDEIDIKQKAKPELLLDENVPAFNALVEKGRAPDLRFANLSGLDLRHAKLNGLDLSGCYMRGANLSGTDLSGCNLFGVTLKGVNISGVLFPEEISAEEIRLSVEYGTRLRVKRTGT